MMAYVRCHEIFFFFLDFEFETDNPSGTKMSSSKDIGKTFKTEKKEEEVQPEKSEKKGLPHFVPSNRNPSLYPLSKILRV